MADEKELQLAQMFAMRDGMEGKKEEEPADPAYNTGEILSADQDKEQQPPKEEPVAINSDPWNEEIEDAASKKQKLSSIQFLFPRSGDRKNSPKMPKLVEPNTTEKEGDDYEEYGATQLLDEDEKDECSYKLIAVDSGQEVYINKPVFLIGCQKSACDMVIPQEVKTHVVSRRHAYILLKNEKAYVKDISSNGTFIGTEDLKDSDFYRLPKDTEVELKDRQIIKLANIKLMIVFKK